MAFESDAWSRAGIIRLLRALRQVTDEDFESEPVLEEVSGDFAARGSAYEEAIERAVAAARRGSKARLRKETRSRDRMLTALLQPPPPFGAYRTTRSGGWPFVDAFLKASFEHRYSNPQAMHLLALMARDVALETAPESYPPGVVFDLRARACAELANAERVLERYRKAEEVLRHGRGWHAMGSGDATLLARLDDVEASLRIEQRRLPEALGLLEQAHGLYLEIGEHHLAGRTLISRARVVQTQGNPSEAIQHLDAGMLLLDPVREPALVRAAKQALLSNLVDCGEYRRAGELLLEGGLGEAFADEPLNLLRLRWVEGKIHAGLGRLARAETVFSEVRAGFRAHSLEYDAALAGLDLAAVWLRQGEAGRLHPLALEILETFLRLDLPSKEALSAVAYLEAASDWRVATAPMVERTRDFLVRLQANPELKFESSAVFWG